MATKKEVPTEKSVEEGVPQVEKPIKEMKKETPEPLKAGNTVKLSDSLSITYN